MMPIVTECINQLPQHLISHGTALNNTIRQVAGSIGTAILVTIMTQQTTEHLAKAITTSTIDMVVTIYSYLRRY
ncbi:drug resistance MFS transporter, drug:H+ antiporter-2 (14 Spanner) (DHA2) family [Priestia megaterium Q3]|uniref:Drug resistance MFS transporter, drug:H+ antiporter-2 (14 Spanner) (DHA2) family n=1 Tax=Priestia megaterium Q3 TaxID=1452722 RepID=A0A806TGD1_PRIMG|nr:drug resistance MFS transporter, drug:H+ antiporter-2 (14 Spanner) (DHA2) family [Priestia megaterium Q3]